MSIMEPNSYNMEEKLISPGSIVTKALIWKEEYEQTGNPSFECELSFDDGNKVKYEMERYNGELEDDKYTKGIYEWDGTKFIQIENWEE